MSGGDREKKETPATTRAFTEVDPLTRKALSAAHHVCESCGDWLDEKHDRWCSWVCRYGREHPGSSRISMKDMPSPEEVDAAMDELVRMIRAGEA